MAQHARRIAAPSQMGRDPRAAHRSIRAHPRVRPGRSALTRTRSTGRRRRAGRIDSIQVPCAITDRPGRGGIGWVQRPEGGRTATSSDLAPTAHAPTEDRPTDQ